MILYIFSNLKASIILCSYAYIPFQDNTRAQKILSPIIAASESQKYISGSCYAWRITSVCSLHHILCWQLSIICAGAAQRCLCGVASRRTSPFFLLHSSHRAGQTAPLNTNPVIWSKLLETKTRRACCWRTIFFKSWFKSALKWQNHLGWKILPRPSTNYWAPTESHHWVMFLSAWYPI